MGRVRDHKRCPNTGTGMLPEGPLGGTADRAASLAKITEELRESHCVEYAVRRHAAFTCHLNPPMHMVKLADGVGIWIDAKHAAAYSSAFSCQRQSRSSRQG